MLIQRSCCRQKSMILVVLVCWTWTSLSPMFCSSDFKCFFFQLTKNLQIQSNGLFPFSGSMNNWTIPKSCFALKPKGGQKQILATFWVFFTLFPKITQVCVKVNCYTILCKIDEVFTQSNVGVLTFYTILCKNVNLYTGMCNDSISCICDKFYINLCNFTQSCVILHLFV